LLSEITRLFFGNAFLVSILVSIIGTAITFVVLGRYLGSFDWWRWLIISFVGALIGFVLGAIIGGILYYFIQQATHQTSISDNFLSSLAFFGSINVVLSLTVAIAQWRILVDYAHWRDRGLWLVANLLSGIVGALIFSARESLGLPNDLSTVAGIVSVIITSLIVGYALSRILQKYAPQSPNLPETRKAL